MPHGPRITSSSLPQTFQLPNQKMPWLWFWLRAVHKHPLPDSAHRPGEWLFCVMIQIFSNLNSSPGLYKDSSAPVSRSRSSTLNIPGLTTSKSSPDGSTSPVDMGTKLVIVMVGLPARGKSYLVKKIARYLNWCQYNTKVFNVGDSRRSFAAASNRTGQHSADFFDPNNDQAAQTREQLALATLDDLLDYVLDKNGCVGIFDATNSVLKRRKLVMHRIRERAGPDVGVLFLESQCEDQSVSSITDVSDQLFCLT